MRGILVCNFQSGKLGQIKTGFIWRNCAQLAPIISIFLFSLSGFAFFLRDNCCRRQLNTSFVFSFVQHMSVIQSPCGIQNHPQTHQNDAKLIWKLWKVANEYCHKRNCTNDFTMSLRQPINWFLLKYIQSAFWCYFCYLLCIENEQKLFKLRTSESHEFACFTRMLACSFVRLFANPPVRPPAWYTFVFIKINRDMCNCWMTNNKTFTSTFLTCLVSTVVRFDCLFSMDYSNENRTNACWNNIGIVLVSLFVFPTFEKTRKTDRTILELSKKVVA